MNPPQVADLPLVTAIVPAYNAEAYVEQTLQSLLDQSYANLEIIVVDDGSTDGTAQRVGAMAKEHRQIRLVRQPNLGVAAARNRGIEESRGEFIAPVDADDIWFPDAVTKLVTCIINSDPRVGVVYGWSVIIDESGLLDGRFRCSKIEGNVLGTLICHNFLGNASATMIRRECFEKVGGYDGRFRTESAQGCEDWDLYLRLAQHYRFKVVPEFLFGYRKLRSGMTSDLSSMAASHRQVLELARQRHPGLPTALCRLSTSSFYLYLAHESYYRRQPSDSFQRLRQALVSAPLFTLLRPVFYLLTAKNFAAILGASITRFIGRKRQIDSGQVSGTPASRAIIQVKDVEGKWGRVCLINLAQSTLHRIVMRIAI